MQPFHVHRVVLSLALVCLTMVAVEPFSFQSQSVADRPVKRRSNPYALHGCKDDGNNAESPQYLMGGVNLWARWIELVTEGHVTAVATLVDDADEETELRVRYGVRLDEDYARDASSLQQEPQTAQQRLSEFAEILCSAEEEEGREEESPGLRDRVTSINNTLADMQQSQSNNGMAIQCVYEGPYASQLQLLRTLRPPRSKDMSSGKADVKVSCQPPPYVASKDSFLVGSLRLFGDGEFHGDGQPRERAARLMVPRDGNGKSSLATNDDSASWDVYHNVSPIDPRGHYLLLPALDNEREWREQSLLPADCYDVTYLASTIDPPGSMILSFNSVGAGASQNHIHCHAWVCPPPPLLGKTDPAEHAGGYAASKAPAITSLHLAHGISVSLLDYPCTCIKLTVPTSQHPLQGVDPVLKEMGNALTAIVQIAQNMEAPHNVAWTNDSMEGNAVAVDAYVFFRRAELSDRCNGIFRSGGSEMMGVFHSSSKEQLESMEGNMAGVLSDVSWEPRATIWNEVCQALKIIGNSC